MTQNTLVIAFKSNLILEHLSKFASPDLEFHSNGAGIKIRFLVRYFESKFLTLNAVDSLSVAIGASRNELQIKLRPAGKGSGVAANHGSPCVHIKMFSNKFLGCLLAGFEVYQHT